MNWVEKYGKGFSWYVHGIVGDVYLHTGIVSEGVWLYVPADWNEIEP